MPALILFAVSVALRATGRLPVQDGPPHFPHRAPPHTAFSQFASPGAPQIYHTLTNMSGLRNVEYRMFIIFLSVNIRNLGLVLYIIHSLIRSFIHLQSGLWWMLNLSTGSNAGMHSAWDTSPSKAPCTHTHSITPLGILSIRQS